MKKRCPGIGLLIWSAVLIFLTVQCARRGTPTGGPVDEEPPVLLKAEPPNYTRNFKGNEIVLDFDEFVKLNDIDKQLVISPPQKYKPIIKPQGNASQSVEITLMDTLAENTTYSINFGQSIVDNNEGNPFPFYTFVFSTGEVLDSLEIRGIVSDAYKRKVDPLISIMLYRVDSTYTDSIIYKELPNYIGSTSDSTSTFRIGNIRAGMYRVVALKDDNTNNLFDPLQDRIGFLSDTIEVPYEEPIFLKLSRQTPDYRATTPTLVSLNQVLFGYLGKADSLIVEPNPSLPDSVRTRMMPDAEADSLRFYMTTFDWDTIQFLVKNPRIQQVDTFVVRRRDVPNDSLQLTPNHPSVLPYYDSFRIAANIPIDSLNVSRFLVLQSDSIPLQAEITLDSTRNRVDFDFERVPSTSYRIAALPGAITDFFGQVNDTLQFSVKTPGFAEVGNLMLNLEGSPEFPLILELTDKEDKPILKRYSTEETRFDFPNMPPGQYGVRIVYDTNGNKEWDPGDFLRGTQPEIVKYYPGYIELRANWEQNETFILDPTGEQPPEEPEQRTLSLPGRED